MEKSEIKRILSAPISFVRESTQKESEIFRDKKNAWFYTFGLASGQEFVGALFDIKEPHVNFRPVPEHNLLPNLREILWGYDRQIYFGGSGPSDRRLMKVLVVKGVSDSEREFYEECLGAKGRERLIKYTDKGIESYIGIARNQFDESRFLLKSHSLRDIALELKENLIRQAEASKAISVAEKTLAYHKDKLATAQENLRQILTSKKEGKLIQQKLKERRQNG